MRSANFIFSGVFLCALILGGCGGKEEAQKEAPKPAPAVSAPEAAPIADESETALKGGEAMMMEAKPVVDGAVEVVEAGETNDLVGTTWKLGEFEVTFKDATTILVKGGPIADLSPNGVEGTYTLDGGVVEVSVMGTSRAGTWDGENLVMDDVAGEKVEAQ